MTTRASSRVALLFVCLVASAAVAPACRLPSLHKEMAETPGLAQTSFLYASDWNVITSFHAETNRVIVPLKKIPTDFRNAVIAVEDKRFYEHQGIDIRAVVRAAYENAGEGRIVQGASTITEQYVRQAFLSPEQTYVRKLNEAALAWQMEREYTKDEVLAKYLNTVYFGEGAYGIQAAAHAYFSRDPRQLTLPQAAMLAGLIAAPSSYDPVGRSHKVALERRNLVLGLMLDQGMITETEYRRANRAPINLRPEKQDQEHYFAPYFVDYVERWFLSNPVFGATYEERYNLLFNGGLRIHTTLDPQMQKYADKAVNGILHEGSDPYGALVALDPTTGAVKAMVGGRDYFGRNSQFAKVNLATGGSTGRQAGSSFKPFVLVAALEEGLSPSKTYSAPSCIDIPLGQGRKPWHVCNAEGSGYGSLTIEQATISSVNTVFAQIIMDVGPDKAVRVAKRMGIRCCTYATQPTTPLGPYPSAVLGTNEVNPLEMASGIGTLANGGIHVQPTAVTKITDSDKNVLYDSNPEPKEVLSPDVVATANSILQKVVQYGTGTAANIGRPQIGKTGTAQNYSDAWFIGAVPQLATAVWVGYPQGQKSMCCTRIGTVFGGTWPAQIWHSFMARATAHMPRESFPRGGVRYVTLEVDASRDCLPNKYTPPGLVKRVTYVEGTEPTKKCTEPTGWVSIPVPSVLGTSKQFAKSELGKHGFEVKVLYEESDEKPGFVIRQTPAPGDELQTSKTVVLVVSKEPHPK